MNLYNMFIDDLDNEAKRIVVILKEKNNINMESNIGEVIKRTKELLDDNYKYYSTDIAIRVGFYLNDNITNEMLEKRKKEDLETILEYTDYSKSMGKDIDGVAKKMADIIISNNFDNISLAKIIADNINELLPEHNDTVDARAIVFYLQDKLRNRGYLVKKIYPLKIIKIYVA